MRFETFVALRYLRSKRRNRFISLITFISVAGVSVGVIALIVVMSVMTGFDIALRDTIIGNRAHLTLESRLGQIDDWQMVVEELEATVPEIVAAGPIIQVEGLLKKATNRSDPHSTGALIFGVDIERETQITHLAENLSDAGGRTASYGELPGFKEVMIGYRLADRIRATVGQQLHVTTDKAKVTPFGVRPGSRLVLTISGIFEARMSEFDMLYAFVDLETARLLSGRDGVDGIHCKLEDPFTARVVGDQIEDESDGLLRATTWYESQVAFFEALKQEKVAMFIILVFIVLVAAFNITSTLIMVVMEKRRDIGILRTLGSSSGSIYVLFILEGLLIGLSGTFVGVIAGTLLAYNLTPVAEFVAGLMGVDLFNSQIYYFDRIPVAVLPFDIAMITVSAIVLSFLSTLYPAWSATRVEPVEALRYE
jgi:lipoprotein-releasing system permease protein